MLIKHMGTLINKVMLVRIHCNHQMLPSLQIKLDKVQIILAKKVINMLFMDLIQ